MICRNFTSKNSCHIIVSSGVINSLYLQTKSFGYFSPTCNLPRLVSHLSRCWSRYFCINDEFLIFFILRLYKSVISLFQD